MQNDMEHTTSPVKEKRQESGVETVMDTKNSDMEHMASGSNERQTEFSGAAEPNPYTIALYEGGWYIERANDKDIEEMVSVAGPFADETTVRKAPRLREKWSS